MKQQKLSPTLSCKWTDGRVLVEMQVSEMGLKSNLSSSRLWLNIPHERAIPLILGANKFRELEQSVAEMCQRSNAQNKKDMLYEALCHWTLCKKRPIPRQASQRIADQIKNCKQFKGIALFAMQSDWLIDDPDYSLSMEKRWTWSHVYFQFMREWRYIHTYLNVKVYLSLRYWREL